MSQVVSNFQPEGSGVSRRTFVGRSAAVAAGSGVFGAALAGCGAGGGTSNQSAGTTNSAAPKALSGTVTWFMRASGAELQWEQASVAAFKQAQPSVTVNLETVSSSADFDPKLTALQAGGTPPDVWTHWGQSGFGDYYAKGMLGELQSFINRDKLDMNPFFANVHEAWKREGKLYGLSFNQRFATFVYYNKDLFQRAGIPVPPVDWNDASWTWEKMLDSSKKLTNPDVKVWGFAAGAQPRTWGMAYLFGGDFFTKEHYEKGIARQSNIGTPEVQAAMQAEADAITKLQIWPNDADRATLGTPAPGYTDMFVKGNLAMLYDTGSEWPKIDKDASFEWGVAAAPRQKSNKNINFINPLMISKESKNKDASWAFIKWQISEPGQRVLVQHTFQPVLKSLLEEWLKSGKSLKQPVADVRKAVEGAAPNTQIGPNQ
ncbi:MAG TPA: sugar ABC transporter substrate-binding protein, partial [Chloroflexota bacterium]|nr:sugar ABC transporter substrate-binding protein [Chloroflexota bacterium]